MFLSRSSTKDFKFIQQRVESKLKGWRSKCLSQAGRCTLIKSVAQAIPTFEVPSTICDNIDAITRRFWWNPKKSSGRYLAWKAWDKLCQSKNEGRLGFRKSRNFNKALLAKFAWMVASNRDSLCMRLVRCKYKVRKDWLRKKPCKSASPIWKAIEKSKKLLSLGACYEVGNRMDINVWQDPWILKHLL